MTPTYFAWLAKQLDMTKEQVDNALLALEAIHLGTLSGLRLDLKNAGGRAKTISSIPYMPSDAQIVRAATSILTRRERNLES